MKVRDLRKLLVGMHGDIDVLVRFETTSSVYLKDVLAHEEHDNGEKKFLVLSTIDPNEDPAERRTREFMRGR